VLRFTNVGHGRRLKRNEILEALQPLVGLSLTIARKAGSTRGFHCGAIRPHSRGSCGEYALHLQCSWRIDGPDGIVTGTEDLWQHVEPDVRPDDWSHEHGDSLQDARLGELLGSFDPVTRSWINSDGRLTVSAIDASDRGDLTIDLAGGFTLRAFPAGSRDEMWRLFQPGTEQAHFVAVAHEA
jgi:hypothetical protein